MPIAKEQIRQIISQNDINSVANVYTLLKDIFKDILQELMEAELDASLGYDKCQKGEVQTDNKRNGYSQKTVKASMVNSNWRSPETAFNMSVEEKSVNVDLPW